ncbi:MAG: hypothetical protein R2704_03070 [Microthrixaceae bacterium]
MVDDGSIDDTVNAARAAAASPPCRSTSIGAHRARHAVDGGYDGAIQLDADGQHDPEEISRIPAGLGMTAPTW